MQPKVRARGASSAGQSIPSAEVIDQFIQKHILDRIESLDLPRLRSQYSRNRLRYVLVGFLLIWLWFLWPSRRPVVQFPSSQLFPDIDLLGTNVTTRLPHIPPKIWQIYLDYEPQGVSPYNLQNWVTMNPSHTYTLLDTPGALSVVRKLAHMPDHAHVLPLFYAMGRRVLRVDFVRYLLLGIEGGVYSDMDTQLVRSISQWVPEEFRNETKLIVGIEADQSPPVDGTTYEVQFCQWTLAGAPGHPTFWKMVNRILKRIQDRPFEDPPKDVDFTDNDVLDVTGPAGWTEVVYEHLYEVTGKKITWHNLTGMVEPKLYGDVLILPINGFATGVPHSHASRETVNATLIRHQFQGTWRDGKD